MVRVTGLEGVSTPARAFGDSLYYHSDLLHFSVLQYFFMQVLACHNKKAIRFFTELLLYWYG